MTLLNRLRRLLEAPSAGYGTTGTGWSGQSGGATARTAVRPYAAAPTYGRGSYAPAAGDDQAAVDRYRYLLRTAPPEQIERVHADAFARLTPAQRQEILAGLHAEVPEGERVASADDPRALARMATRAEMRRPGALERVFGGSGTTAGRAMVGGLLAGVAGAVVGSLVIDGLFDTGAGDGGLFDLGPDESFGLGFGGFDGGFDF